MRKLIFSIILTAALAPAGAHADVAGGMVSDVTQKLGAIWNFFGSAEPETGTAAPIGPVETAPIPRLTPLAPRPLAAPTESALATPEVPEFFSPAVLPKPSVETPLKKLFCVEYARAVSGLAIFGDAKFWWERAKNLYARASRPLEEAVMVFSGSPRLKRGHVAVVTDIVGPREIRVNQANWMNKGEIDHATPVLDVSTRNDWSKVRVWDVRSGGFGAHIYPVSGFIIKGLTRQAFRD